MHILMKVLLTEILLATTVFAYAQKWSGKIEGKTG